MLRDLRRRLRPMGFADILDEAFELYKKNFLLLFLIGACAYVPLALLQAAMGQPLAFAAAGREPAPGQIVPELGKLVLYVILYWLAAAIATGALTFATSDRYLDRPTSAGACYRRVASPGLILSFLVANIMAGLAALAAALVPLLLIVFAAMSFAEISSIGGPAIILGVLLGLAGLAALSIPIYVASRLAVYTPAFFVEGGGASASLRRSWQLLKGRVLSTFGMLFVVSLVILVLRVIIESPISVVLVRDSLQGGTPSAFALGLAALVDSVLDALLMPVNSLVLILIYYDARIRKEGFDLEILAGELDQRAGVTSAFTRPLPHEPESAAPPVNPQEPQR